MVDSPPSDILVYHLARAAEWTRAATIGSYEGSSDDRRDGFLHFSTASQIVESARKHRAGEEGLILVCVRSGELGDALRWEPSRGGDLFPHLYGKLSLDCVRSAQPLELGAGGQHVFPSLDERA